MLEILGLPLAAGAAEVAVAAGIGVRILHSGDTAQIAMRDADIAMYSAKWSGKARWKAFDPETGAQAARRIALIGDLPRGSRCYARLPAVRPAGARTERRPSTSA